MAQKFSGDFIRFDKKKVKDETSNLAFYLFTRITFYVLLIFFAIFFIWYTVFISTHSFYAVSGVSMMGTLNGQITAQRLESGEDLRNVAYDAVYIDRSSSARVFDIVVIQLPDKKESIIKRLMAQEGDYISIAKVDTADGGQEYRFFRIPKGADPNNFTDDMAMVEEDGTNGYSIYSYQNWNTRKPATDPLSLDGGTHAYEDNFYTKFLAAYDPQKPEYHVSQNGLLYVQVPKGKIFYMGDNRGHSDDARENGFCDKSCIVGRSEFIIYNFNFGNRLLEVVKFYFKQVEKFFVR